MEPLCHKFQLILLLFLVMNHLQHKPLLQEDPLDLQGVVEDLVHNIVVRLHQADNREAQEDLGSHKIVLGELLLASNLA